MPGKVNPAILEMVAIVAFHVVGAETAVAMAVQAGQLELNVMMPTMAFEICFSAEILRNALTVLKGRCIDGITANEERCRRFAELSPSLATALNPYIGYARGAAGVKESLRTRRTTPEVARDNKPMSARAAQSALGPMR